MSSHESTPPNMDTVSNQLQKDFKEFRSAARWWSLGYHGCQFGSAALSAFAAFTLKTEMFGDPTFRNDLSALCAFVAALSITILTTGRFKEKWEANRIAAFAVRDLVYQMEKSDANPDAILGELQRIGLMRNNNIVGITTEIKQAGGKKHH